MVDKYYEIADKYMSNDDLENAIEYFKLSLKYNSNYDSAYRLGTIYLDCYEDLGSDKPDYQNAIKYFLSGTKNGNNGCRKELISVLIKCKNKCIVFDGIKCILSSWKYESKKELDMIKKAIGFLYSNANQQEEDIKSTIQWFNEIASITRNNETLKPVYRHSKELINEYTKKILKNLNSLKELETAFKYFQPYLDKDPEIRKMYGAKEADLYIKQADDVLDVEKYLLSLNNKKLFCDIQTKNILYLWLARSYRDGNHNAERDIDTAIKYYKKITNDDSRSELEAMLISYCDESIKNNDYETARKYVSNINSKDYYRIKRAIDEYDKAKRASEDKMTGNINVKAPYAQNNYKDVCTEKITSVDTDGNIIYYMFDYYKKWWKENYPDNQFYEENFFTFMSIKKRDYDPKSRPINFPTSLCKFFGLLSGNWIICTAPGHEKTVNDSNGVSDIINMVHLKPNFILRNTLIQRAYSVDKKATSTSGRNNNYQVDMKSLQIESGVGVKGKNIIVIDDITTSGSTLIACRNLLMNAGANKVVLLAFGKTKSQGDYEF